MPELFGQRRWRRRFLEIGIGSSRPHILRSRLSVASLTDTRISRHVSFLRVQDLRFHGFGPFSFEIDRRERVFLTGASGVGKSLMLRSLADLDPHEGDIWLENRHRDDFAAPQWRRRVGLLPPESRWWRPTVADHFKASPIQQMHELDLPEAILGRDPLLLSTGERQRLALLRLLEQRPSMLLLDEPTANLDPENTARVETFIETYQVREKVAILWISHDRGQPARLGGRKLEMTPDCLVEHPTPAPL